MIENKVYIDTAGREYRKVGEQWQMLKSGVGWIEFIGATYIIDVGLVNTAPDEVDHEESESQYTTAENDLFKHYAGLAMQGMIRNYTEGVDGCDYSGVALFACNQAQAIIDELKARGRL